MSLRHRTISSTITIHGLLSDFPIGLSKLSLHGYLYFSFRGSYVMPHRANYIALRCRGIETRITERAIDFQESKTEVAPVWRKLVKNVPSTRSERARCFALARGFKSNHYFSASRAKDRAYSMRIEEQRLIKIRKYL